MAESVADDKHQTLVSFSANMTEDTQQESGHIPRSSKQLSETVAETGLEDDECKLAQFVARSSHVSATMTETKPADKQHISAHNPGVSSNVSPVVVDTKPDGKQQKSSNNSVSVALVSASVKETEANDKRQRSEISSGRKKRTEDGHKKLRLVSTSVAENKVEGQVSISDTSSEQSVKACVTKKPVDISQNLSSAGSEMIGGYYYKYPKAQKRSIEVNDGNVVEFEEIIQFDVRNNFVKTIKCLTCLGIFATKTDLIKHYRKSHLKYKKPRPSHLQTSPKRNDGDYKNVENTKEEQSTSSTMQAGCPSGSQIVDINTKCPKVSSQNDDNSFMHSVRGDNRIPPLMDTAANLPSLFSVEEMRALNSNKLMTYIKQNFDGRDIGDIQQDTHVNNSATAVRSLMDMDVSSSFGEPSMVLKGTNNRLFSASSGNDKCTKTIPSLMGIDLESGPGWSSSINSGSAFQNNFDLNSSQIAFCDSSCVSYTGDEYQQESQNLSSIESNVVCQTATNELLNKEITSIVEVEPGNTVQAGKVVEFDHLKKKYVKGIKCLKCLRMFPRKLNFKRHYRNVHLHRNTDRHVKDACTSFVGVRSFPPHTITVEPGVQVQAVQVMGYDSLLQKFAHHFKCVSCSKLFSKKYDFICHQRECHLKFILVYICPVDHCNKSFKWPVDVLQHCQNIHDVNMAGICLKSEHVLNDSFQDNFSSAVIVPDVKHEIYPAESDKHAESSTWKQDTEDMISAAWTQDTQERSLRHDSEVESSLWKQDMEERSNTNEEQFTWRQNVKNTITPCKPYKEKTLERIDDENLSETWTQDTEEKTYRFAKQHRYLAWEPNTEENRLTLRSDTETRYSVYNEETKETSSGYNIGDKPPTAWRQDTEEWTLTPRTDERYSTPVKFSTSEGTLWTPSTQHEVSLYNTSAENRSTSFAINTEDVLSGRPEMQYKPWNHQSGNNVYTQLSAWTYYSEKPSYMLCQTQPDNEQAVITAQTTDTKTEPPITHHTVGDKLPERTLIPQYEPYTSSLEKISDTSMWQHDAHYEPSQFSLNSQRNINDMTYSESPRRHSQSRRNYSEERSSSIERSSYSRKSRLHVKPIRKSQTSKYSRSRSRSSSRSKSVATSRTSSSSRPSSSSRSSSSSQSSSSSRSSSSSQSQSTKRALSKN